VPIYVFECKSCGYRQESLERMDCPNEELRYCPLCHILSWFKKVPTACAFHLKGNGSVGWASSGYASKLTADNDTINKPEYVPNPEVPVNVTMEPLE
jgi:putative FmdB family regulatory protein